MPRCRRANAAGGVQPHAAAYSHHRTRRPGAHRPARAPWPLRCSPHRAVQCSRRWHAHWGRHRAPAGTAPQPDYANKTQHSATLLIHERGQMEGEVSERVSTRQRRRQDAAVCVRSCPSHRRRASGQRPTAAARPHRTAYAPTHANH